MSHTPDAIAAFVDEVSERTGYAALSDHKVRQLGTPEAITVVAEDDSIRAVGVVGVHIQHDGTTHYAIETVVELAMQFADFERQVVIATLASVPPGGAVSVWSTRDTLSTALGSLGFHRVRSLAFMEVDLPIGSVGAEGLRPFRTGDAEELVRVNNAAFTGHREAGVLTLEEFAAYASEPWFDPDGIIVSGEGRLSGFCWTRIHGDGDGEIFRIAVDPRHQGSGLGHRLLDAGFAHLAEQAGVQRGTLWVDMENRVALDLYTSIGMRIVRRNSEFERTG